MAHNLAKTDNLIRVTLDKKSNWLLNIKTYF
jgi:hypothetical protein